MKLTKFVVGYKFTDDFTKAVNMVATITVSTLFGKKTFNVFRESYIKWRHMDNGRLVHDRLQTQLEDWFNLIQFLERLERSKTQQRS